MLYSQLHFGLAEPAFWPRQQDDPAGFTNLPCQFLDGVLLVKLPGNALQRIMVIRQRHRLFERQGRQQFGYFHPARLFSCFHGDLLPARNL